MSKEDLRICLNINSCLFLKEDNFNIIVEEMLKEKNPERILSKLIDALLDGYYCF
jgi:hypothetical protein